MRYIKLKNKHTGEEIIVNPADYRYKRLAMGFLNKSSMFPYQFRHVVLTQKRENYKPNLLNNFFNSLRRYYLKHAGNVMYIWTSEVQEKRKDKYKESVLHWHVILALPFDYDFDQKDVLRLQKYWKYGNVDVRYIKADRVNLRYVMKYITKSLGDIYSNVRRVGSSKIEGYYRQSKKYFLQAVQFLLGFGVSFSDFIWVRGNAYVIDVGDCQKKYCVYRKYSEWQFVGILEGEPF